MTQIFTMSQKGLLTLGFTLHDLFKIIYDIYEVRCANGTKLRNASHMRVGNQRTNINNKVRAMFEICVLYPVM